MARWIEHLTLIAVISVLAGLSLWLQFGLLDSGDLGQSRKATDHTPDYTVENFTAKGTTEEGLPAWLLKGDRLVHYPDDGSALIDNPDLIEYQQGEQIRQTTAGRGALSGDGEVIVLTGNVIIATESKRGDNKRTIVKTDRMKIRLKSGQTLAQRSSDE